MKKKTIIIIMSLIIISFSSIYAFFKDDVARLGSDAPNGTRDDYQYELDEAQSIYDQYKNKTITTQQAYDRIIKIKYTDRQNGVTSNLFIQS